jgi:hypothetical protein
MFNLDRSTRTNIKFCASSSRRQSSNPTEYDLPLELDTNPDTKVVCPFPETIFASPVPATHDKIRPSAVPARKVSDDEEDAKAVMAFCGPYGLLCYQNDSKND